MENLHSDFRTFELQIDVQEFVLLYYLAQNS
jgi:hypothetical protein